MLAFRLLCDMLQVRKLARIAFVSTLPSPVIIDRTRKLRIAEYGLASQARSSIFLFKFLIKFDVFAPVRLDLSLKISRQQLGPPTTIVFDQTHFSTATTQSISAPLWHNGTVKSDGKVTLHILLSVAPVHC
mmetsp:Transcript_35774/g.76386  ORF Transcript_35774/g.76386 Transcript_35774/m.76386 type:complete len:131 (-) Transcript_35774:172-564(-)